jgi:hypothetical protein
MLCCKPRFIKLQVTDMSLKSFVPSAAVILLATSAQASNPWTYQESDDRIGRIYYYERTNIDGSMDERVTVFRRDATHLEVYKENGLCGRAALVTAELDLKTLSAPVITGGALQPDAQHVEFAFLELNPETGKVDMLVKLPDMEVRDDVEIGTANWTLFDFDLASLTVATPHLDNPEDGFGFGMALLWADSSTKDPLFWMGELNAEHVAQREHLGVLADEYRLTGSAFEIDLSTGEEGRLWLDSEDGHVVDAVMPIPNHPGYTDFRLRLLNVSDGGETEWTALLRAHFEGCSG